MFTGESIQVRQLEDGILELIFDRRGESINKFDRRTVDELRAATDAICQRNDVLGVLVTSTKNTFIVGADIFEFAALFDNPAEDIAAHIGAQSEVFRAFEDLEVPIVTALNGIAFGGGLEMALASDYRVAADSALLGLPEVNLGLFPGYGGTVRLPRLANAALALDWISTGKTRSAHEALAGGVVDEVVELHRVRDSALIRLKSAIGTDTWRARRTSRRGPFALDAAAVDAVRARLRKEAGHQPAALAAVELICACAALERDAALRRESQAFAQIARTQAAAALVQLFVNEQYVKNKVKSQVKRAGAPERIGVIGAGIMGGGIAYSAAVSGLRVSLTDIAPKALEQGMTEARKHLDKQVRSGRMNQARAAEVIEAIHPQSHYDGFEQLDIVVEAVVEDAEVKAKVLAEALRHLRPEAVLATNTSSLSVTTLAERLARPDRFIGIHFFNPVPVMPLVEIVQGAHTAAHVVDAAVGFSAKLGKTPIVVRDGPGFLVNRILTAYLIGFFLALRDGADFRVVDRVMEEFGWPMGPAYLQDVIGMDTMLRVVELISAGYPQRLGYDCILAPEVLVKAGRLGQKSGTGYYRYEADPRGKPTKFDDPQAPELLSVLRSQEPQPFSDREIFERLMLPMMIEAALCLEDGVAGSAQEIDLAMVLGLGFPRHAAGPLKYADWQGLREVVARCTAHEALGALYRPTARMLEMSQRDQRFFPVGVRS
jgi:3-hydroxyacyl-CoA dehydrogenase/enoyl-CoA hydratase/3-hydroxybutyryl-CoA epimerase/enoyl-CoA isomerase